ncbi:type II secretion system protein [bacterium]|nr:MAG: type II secretion system protein [bacterium]
MKRAFTLIEAVIVIAGVLILAMFLWPVLARARDNNRRSSCQSNLKQIGLGFMQYVRDYDETMPPARPTSLTGWANVLQPYVKSVQLFQCPSAQQKTTLFASDYFYNRRLARRSFGQMTNSAWTIMVGEGPDSASTWSSWTKLPADASTNHNSPTQRHFDGANYCFLDGHVKFLTPQEVSASKQIKWTMD